MDINPKFYLASMGPMRALVEGASTRGGAVDALNALAPQLIEISAQEALRERLGGTPCLIVPSTSEASDA